MTENDSNLYVGYDGTGYFKIGITNNPQKRLKQIRTGNPTFTFLWCFSCENAAIMEIELHTKFSEKIISGEWFDLIPEDLEYILLKFNKEHSDIFNTWNEIANKKIALDKKHLNSTNEYWNSIGKSNV